jgi:hypothetical protein
MAFRTNANQQRETQLLMEWLLSLGPGMHWKTHVNVGAEILSYNGRPLTPAMARAFGTWQSWADARVFTGTEVLLVEAKLVALGTAYGEILDYLSQYPSSADYKQFSPAPIRGVVLCAFARDRTRALFSNYGIQTVIFTPGWAAVSLATKVFSGVDTAGSPIRLP